MPPPKFAATTVRVSVPGVAVGLNSTSRPPPASSVTKNRGLAIKADADDQSAVRAAVQATAKEFGKIDILVNNAGVLALGLIADFPVDDFEKALSVNVRSVFTAIQEALRYMPDGGRIITIGSVNSDRMPLAW